VLHGAAAQAMRALAGIHRVAWRDTCAYLGDPVPFADDVERWDRFLPKLAEPQRFALQPRVRRASAREAAGGCADRPIPRRLPGRQPVFSFAGELLAVIDWELTGIGATLNDVGWLATFNTKAAWDETRGSMVPSAGFPSGDELVAMYQEAWGAKLPDVAWFRALAAYKFAIIAGFNLGLHRRGKRHDPLWEITALSIAPLLEHAAGVCSGEAARDGCARVIGRAVVTRLCARAGVEVVGLARRAPDAGLVAAVRGGARIRLQWVSCDLRDAAATRAALAAHRDTTHLVYAALYEKPS